MSESICEICVPPKKFKSSQGLAGHMHLAHGISASAKKRERGGGVQDRFSQLKDFVHLRYELVTTRFLEIELDRLERQLSSSALSTQPSMPPSNVLVIPHQQQQTQRLCPACGADIPETYSPRRRAELNLQNGVLVAYPCPNCGAGLYPRA